MSRVKMRWGNYFLRSGGGFSQFWSDFLAEQERRVLFIVGHGFDTRMCDGIEAILGAGGLGARDTVLITFDEGPESSSHSYTDQRATNEQKLKTLLGGYGSLKRRNIRLFSDEGRRIGSRSIANAFTAQDEILSYTDVVVDISALPRALYFPLLAKLLTIFDRGFRSELKRNLHVVVSHSPQLDRLIQDEGIEENATYLHGFSAASFEREATREQPRVWIPILGAGQQVQLERIHGLVRPDEICPLLPSPASNPREADELLSEYRELLFDQLRVEPRNIIYASEANPFEVYRQLMRSVLHYQKALAPLGGCKAVLSAMSSKLASIGALLTAYELGSLSSQQHVAVGVAHVEAQGYRMVPGEDIPAQTLYTMCLKGECYEA